MQAGRIEFATIGRGEVSNFEMNVGDVNSKKMGTAARANSAKPRFDLMPIEQLAFLVKHSNLIVSRREEADHAFLLEQLGEFQAGRIEADELLVATVMWNMNYQLEPCWTVLESLEEACAVWDYGRSKYAEWNWAKGADWWVPIGCMVRHIEKTIIDREAMDADSGYSHMAHVVCNAMMLYHYERYWKEGDTRPIFAFPSSEEPKHEESSEVVTEQHKIEATDS